MGLNEFIIHNEKLKVYPNPANDVLNIVFDLQGKEFFSKIKILNNLGQVIREEDLKNNSSNIRDLPNGVYYLTLRQAQGDLQQAHGDNMQSASKRFVINH